MLGMCVAGREDNPVLSKYLQWMNLCEWQAAVVSASEEWEMLQKLICDTKVKAYIHQLYYLKCYGNHRVIGASPWIKMMRMWWELWVWLQVCVCVQTFFKKRLWCWVVIEESSISYYKKSWMNFLINAILVRKSMRKHPGCILLWYSVYKYLYLADIICSFL